jgi:hypothetical protein
MDIVLVLNHFMICMMEKPSTLTRTLTLTIVKTGQRPLMFEGFTKAWWSLEKTTVRRGFVYDH